MQKDNDFGLILLLVLAYFLFFGGKVTPGPSGPATIFVPFEESQITTEFADLRADLLTGPPGKPFYEKGHSFLIIDNDTDNSVVKRFAPYDDSRPQVIVFRGDKMLYRFDIDYKQTAEQVAELLKVRGL